MQKEDTISISYISITPQAIHATIKVSTLPSVWILGIVYASNDYLIRKLLQEQLITLSDTLTILNGYAWLIRNDFNKLLRASEKFGGGTF